MHARTRMTLDEFLLVIYQMGYGHRQQTVSLKLLEESVGSEYGRLFQSADTKGYLEKSFGQLCLTSSGRNRVSLFQ